jgi:hypothetical protein
MPGDTTIFRDVRIALEARAPLAVHPPLGEPVTHGRRIADCPVCGAAVMDAGEDLSCTKCDARLHRECFWRSVPLAEWQEWIVQVNGGPDDFASSPTICAQCRAKAGAS